MSDPTPHDVQLLLYGFDAAARFEGRLVGALERMESGGTLRILEAMFLARDAETGELAAVDLRSRGAGSLVSPLIGFRLDEHERKRATERALGGDAGDTLRALGAALAPGDAIAAVLVEHTWSRTLEDAVAQSGGTRISSGFFEVSTLAELLPQLVCATAATPATRNAT
jgi:hypothetical protein